MGQGPYEKVASLHHENLAKDCDPSRRGLSLQWLSFAVVFSLPDEPCILRNSRCVNEVEFGFDESIVYHNNHKCIRYFENNTLDRALFV